MVERGVSLPSGSAGGAAGVLLVPGTESCAQPAAARQRRSASRRIILNASASILEEPTMVASKSRRFCSSKRLSHGAAELMPQTHSRAAKNAQELAGKGASSIIYIEVEDFGVLLEQVKGLDVLLPVGEIFYEMREIAVHEPGGNGVCLGADSHQKTET